MTEFYVKVQPDSENFSISDDTIRKVELERKAENGKANTELVQKFEQILGEKPGIISGHKSRRKKLKIDMPEEEIDRKIQRFKENG